MAEISTLIAQEILKSPGASTEAVGVTPVTVGGVEIDRLGLVEGDQAPPTTEATIAVNATKGEGALVTVVPPTEVHATEGAGPSSNTTTAPTTTTGTPVPTDSEEKDGVTVVISPPKTTEELIAARAIKRIAKKTELRQAAQEFIARGDAYMEIKSFKAASQQFLQATDLCSTDPEYFIKLAGAYRKMKWYEEAAHAATRALTLHPKSSEARYMRGVARLEQRLLKPAKIDFETVLEHDPSHLLARAALTEVTHFISTSTHLGTHTLAASTIDDIVKDVDFSFPAYDFDTENMAVDDGELSDSSDCMHVGNGVPCRFYNHDGCTRGPAECQFSHAPDERSVRDDLGKNVCVYHILSSCKFGPLKCIYSHDKSALPKRGWWTSPEQIERVRGIMQAAEQNAREQREKDAERWKARVKARNAGKEKSKAKATGEEAEAETVPPVASTDGPQEATTAEMPIQSPRSAGPRTHRRGKPRKPQPPKSDADAAAAGPGPGDEPPKSTDVAARAPRRRFNNNKRKKDAPQATTTTSTSGFTDYNPNGHPPANADDVANVSVTLSY